MKPTYQPKVKEKAEQIIEVIENTGFFKDNGIDSKEYAYDRLCEELTDKFITGELDEGSCFTVPEMDFLLKEFVAMSVLDRLKDKGLVQSYGDGDDEVFFLTDLGKKVGKELGYDKLDEAIDGDPSKD